MSTLIFATNTHEKKLLDEEPSKLLPSINSEINSNKEFADNIFYLNNKIFSKIVTSKQPTIINTIKKETPNLLFKIGDRGVKIKEIQQLLNKYGYKITEDGIFGTFTRNSIINFQYKVGLKVDGIVGNQTLARLRIPPTQIKIYNPNKVVQVKSNAETILNSKGLSSRTKYFIVIDIKNQRVYTFSGYKKHWKLIRSMLCATGKPSTPTVRGVFSVKDKGSMFRAGRNTICKYYTQFYGNYLFHTILLDNNGRIQDPTLGTPVSHGCVRLSIENAKYIYYNIPYGTSVWSY